MNMNYFASIIGHEHLIARLQQYMQTDKISHAYLFLGPDGVGKYMVSWALAWELIAQEDASAHVFYTHESHPDLLVLEREEGKTLIAKDKITSIMEPWLAFKPYRAGYRVVIIRDAHLLSLEAANALLKTLEEPPSYAVIVLTADENNLLETIVSRCQILRFQTVAEERIIDWLKQQGIETQVAKEAALLGQGSMGKAQTFAQEPDFMKYWDIAAESLVKLMRGDKEEIFNLAEKIEKSPELLTGMIELLLRDICIYVLNNEEKNFLLRPGQADLWKMADEKQAQAILKLMPEITELRSYYRKNINALTISTNMAFMLWDMFNHTEGLRRNLSGLGSWSQV